MMKFMNTVMLEAADRWMLMDLMASGSGQFSGLRYERTKTSRRRRDWRPQIKE